MKKKNSRRLNPNFCLDLDLVLVELDLVLGDN